MPSGRKTPTLVALIGHGGFRLDRHERLLQTDESLIKFLEREREQQPTPAKSDQPRRRRLELAVAMQLLYRRAIREGRDRALPYAQAFRDLIVHGVNEGAIDLYLNQPSGWKIDP